MVKIFKPYKNTALKITLDYSDYLNLVINNLSIYLSKSNKKIYARVRLNNSYKYLHRFLVNPKMEVDHINGDSLDNRKKNLRDVTHQENLRNQNLKTRNLPRGVSKKRNKYRAVITHNMKQINLGVFDCPNKAHLAYLKKRKELWVGEKIKKQGCFCWPTDGSSSFQKLGDE